MILRELFDKEFLYESKGEEKMLKIFYKFDIKIKKKEEEQPEQQPEQPEQPVQPQQDTIDLSQPEVPQQDTMTAAPEPIPMDNLQMPEMPTATVVTEDDEDNIKINDDNNIVRKLEGLVTLTKEEVDNIQTLEDLIAKLTETKVDGVEVLDEFTADILQSLADLNTQKQVANLIDKKSMIFTELMYGKKKEDSVGIRIIKRTNSDMVTTTMLIDNQIVNAPYKKETVDERIVNIRNEEYSEDNNNKGK